MAEVMLEPMRRRLIISLVALLAVSGCGAPSTAEQQAAGEARAKARRASNLLYQPGRVWTAQDMGHRADEVRGVEVMMVSGMSTDQRRGERLVIRVMGEASDNKWSSPTTVTVRACFELVFKPEIEWDDSPKEVACPKGAPLTFGPWPKTPALPREGRLRRALPRVPAGGTVNEVRVREAVAGLHLEPAIGSEFVTVGNVVGVSLTVKPYLDGALECLLARVAPGKTEVFTPASRTQRMPGEGGCSAGNAISPMPPPH